MKYDVGSSLIQIERRKKKRLVRRARDKTLLSGGATTVLALLTVLSFVLAVPHEADSVGQSPYGAFLIDGGGGAYVLVGVLAFALGAAFTLLCVYFTRLKKAKSIEKSDQKDQNGED